MTTEKSRPRWLVITLSVAGALAIVLAGVTFAQAMSLRSSPGEAVDMAPIVGEQAPVATITVTPSPTPSAAPSGEPAPVQPSLPTGGIQAPVPVDPVGPSQIDGDDDDSDDGDDDGGDDGGDDED